MGKYAELKPKSSVGAKLAMSKVYLSKSWDLPPRSRPGRRPRTVEAKPQSSDDDEGCYGVEERKKRQNRDAQRAYRERRANKMLELEGVVETLQELVKTWQKKFRDVEIELAASRKRVAVVESENQDLQRRLGEVTGPASAGDADVTLLDPLLQDMIDNFKPMKAVTLKRRRVAAGSPHGGFEATPVSASPGDCGFCSGGTTCVCKELDGAKVDERCTQDTSTCEKCSDIDVSCIRPPAVPRERCLSAPQSSGLSRLLSDSSVAVQTSSSLGSAASLAVETSLSSGFCCSACGYREKEPQGAKEGDLKLLGFDQSEQPNTMDPNFVPGSCSKCQKDPQSKAFCQAVFGPPGSSSRGERASACCGKGSCLKRAP